jgi:hypothetical protein
MGPASSRHAAKTALICADLPKSKDRQVRPGDFRHGWPKNGRL